MSDLCTFSHNGKRYVALVRKLTERECFRLMDVDDTDNQKMIDGLARSSCYRLAGNSIVVSVLYNLFRKLFVDPSDEHKEADLFSLSLSLDTSPHYDHDHPLRVVTLCSGYDSQCLALERLKRDFPPFDYELVFWSEFDPESTAPLDRQPAVMAHNLLFPQWADRNLGDMTKIDWHSVPDFDLLFYSTPCQSISQAGLQHGFVEGSGTRSSIIWNVRDALRIKKPKYAILENVAAMVSAKFLPMFNLWRNEVGRLGYSSFADLLNAKHYDVPQNRNRIFLVSVLDPDGRAHYSFPDRMELSKTLQDLLEDTVDTKYYLDPLKVDVFVRDNLDRITAYMDSSDQPIDILPEHLKQWLDGYPKDTK